MPFFTSSASGRCKFVLAPLNIAHCDAPVGNRTKSGAIPVGCIVYIWMQVSCNKTPLFF
jgi:hypothetical protein